MARDDNPDDEFYGEPTQYANYGGSGGQAYSEVPDQTGHQPVDYGYQTGYGQGPTPEPPTPWFRKPAALVVLGALAALIIALAIYAVVQLAGGSSSTTETTTTTTSPAATEAPAPGEMQTVTEMPPPPPATETVTETPTATTTTEAPTETTTTPSPSVSTSTVTETETVSPTRNWPTLPNLPTIFPRPGEGG